MILKNIHTLHFAILISLTILPLHAAGSASDAKNKVSEYNEEESRTAVTQDGDRVILYSDGTWEYSEEPEEKIERKINKFRYTKPETSTEILEGNFVKYKIWYDKKKWSLLENSINENAEFSLLHEQKNCYLLVVPESLSLPLDNLRDIVLKNIHAVSKKVQVLKEEERVVNNQKVIMLNIKAEIQGMQFLYMYYLYSDDKASMQLIGFTTEEMYPAFGKDIENFLNGFVMTNSETNNINGKSKGQNSPAEPVEKKAEDSKADTSEHPVKSSEENPENDKNGDKTRESGQKTESAPENIPHEDKSAP